MKSSSSEELKELRRSSQRNFGGKSLEVKFKIGLILVVSCRTINEMLQIIYLGGVITMVAESLH